MVFIKMFRTISKSTNRLVGLGLFNIFTMAVITYLSNKLKSTTGVSVPPPDLWFGYDSKEIYEWINQIGVEGRKQYLFIIAWDLFPYMEAYAIFLGSLLMNECNKSNYYKQYEKQLALVFPLVMAFDFIETSTNGYTVIQYPNQINPIIVHISSIANMSKWIGFGVGLSILIALFIQNQMHARKRIVQKSD